MLESFLNFYRKVVVSKVSGVPTEDAKRRLVPSSTTLAGVLRHLAVVERNWFQHIVARQLAPIDDVDASWFVDEATVDELIADYVRACGESRDIASGFALEDVVPHPQLVQVSLRWIYVHLIDETARHAGHLDILRELTDGTTGIA